VKEYPVFIPSGDFHIGAVITVPDTDASGLVVMAPGGGGAPRSHRFALWNKLARTLAENGIASVRLEWPGVGDSTGEIFHTFYSLPHEHLITAAEFAMKATGITRIGLTGNCLAARASIISAPKLPTVESIVLVFLNPLGGTAGSEQVVSVAKSFFGRFPESVQNWARRMYMVVRRIRVGWKTLRGKRPHLIAQIRKLDPSIDLLLLESDTELAGRLPKMVSAMKGEGYNAEIDYLAGTSMRQFESREEQQVVIEKTTAWFVKSFKTAEETSTSVDSVIALDVESPAAVG
jgi:hypothetical protein